MLNKTKELPEYLKKVKEDLEQYSEDDFKDAAESFARSMVGHDHTEDEKTPQASEPVSDRGASASLTDSKDNKAPEYLERMLEDLERCTEEELRAAVKSFLMDIAGCEGARSTVRNKSFHVPIAGFTKDDESSKRLKKEVERLDQCSEEDLKDARDSFVRGMIGYTYLTEDGEVKPRDKNRYKNGGFAPSILDYGEPPEYFKKREEEMIRLEEELIKKEKEDYARFRAKYRHTGKKTDK